MKAEAYKVNAPMFDLSYLHILITSVIGLHKGLSLSKQVISFNENWAFLKGDINLEEVPGSYQQWQSVEIPHTWNVFDPSC
ncbi:MAG: hypothetical protein AAGF85_19345 [Bacteroidota bacterium]